MSAQKASEIYKISRKVIYDWKKLKLETVRYYRAKEGYQKGHCRIVKDREVLAKFLEQNSNKTGAELANDYPLVYIGLVYEQNFKKVWIQL